MSSNTEQRENSNSRYRKASDLSEELWRDLAAKDPDTICLRAGIVRDGRVFRLPFLGDTYIIDQNEQKIYSEADGHEPGFQAGLTLLLYLINASEFGLSGRLVTAREIKGGDLFFQGPHALSISEVIEKYGRDKEGFLKRAESLGGTPMDMGDASFRMLVLPKVLVAYTLYTADDEFPARLIITFDSYVEKHMPLDAILAMINVMSHRLVR